MGDSPSSFVIQVLDFFDGFHSVLATAEHCSMGFRNSSDNIAVHRPKSESRAFGDSYPLLTIISVTLPPMCSMVLSASSPAASRRSGWSPAHPRSCKECFNFNSDPQEINWLVVSTPWRMDACHWGSSFCWMENKNRFNNQPAKEEKKKKHSGDTPICTMH